eukprot:TRINITY_DN3338_c0_g1_i1.p1 TRINITY_DN3338_c0_g1~~TRINITY_DN3338_c0_g1_i1.p1  ORF type:complete len:311 (+),score=37.38 TRINITY_DN3338_c0_g1_i1:212-1144(+)
MLRSWWRYYKSNWFSFLVEILEKQPDHHDKARQFARMYKQRLSRTYSVALFLLHYSIFFTFLVTLPTFQHWMSVIKLFILMTPLFFISQLVRRLGEQSIWQVLYCPLCLYLFDSMQESNLSNIFNYTCLLLLSQVHTIIFYRFMSYTPFTKTKSRSSERSELSYFANSDATFLVLFPTYGSLIYLGSSWTNVGVFLVYLVLLVCYILFVLRQFPFSTPTTDVIVIVVVFKLFLHLLTVFGFLSSMPSLDCRSSWLAVLLVPYLYQSTRVLGTTLGSLFPLLFVTVVIHVGTYLVTFVGPNQIFPFYTEKV